MSTHTLVIAGTLVAVALAAVVSPFASSAPDGLERVAEEHGITAAETPVWASSVMPDYQTPGITHEGLSTGTAGAVGTLLVFVLAFGIGRLLWRPRNQRQPDTG